MANHSQVNYDILDKVKLRCIEASKSTLNFSEFGSAISKNLGASANIFRISTKHFSGQDDLYLSLIPEGLGTADDARPDDLNELELNEFWYNIGIKTVSVITNDAATSGLQTVLIGLYLPSSTPKEVFTEEFLTGFLRGIVDGCRDVRCVYFSGETPELRTKIVAKKLDIAGSAFAMMFPNMSPISGSDMSPGNKIVFLESNGPHENGFTTLRDVAELLTNRYRTDIGDGTQYWRACNAPSFLYTKVVQDILLSGIQPTNIENITGHGWQKIMRSSAHHSYIIEDPLDVPLIFRFVENTLKLQPQQTAAIFNYGVGYAIFCKTDNEGEAICNIAKKHGIKSQVVGHIESSKKGREVICKKYGIHLKGDEFLLAK